MKRIGITQRVEVVGDRRERRDCLDQNWALLGAALGWLLVPLSNRTEDVDGCLEALGLDGVILTGGNDPGAAPQARNTAPERDRFEFRLLDACARRQRPVLGVCRGMQIMNLHYGGRLCRVSGHVRARHRIYPSDAGQRFWPGPIEVNSFHELALTEGDLAADAEPLALVEDGTIEGFRIRDRDQFAVMWHPERESPFADHDIGTLRAVFEEPRR